MTPTQQPSVRQAIRDAAIKLTEKAGGANFIPGRMLAGLEDDHLIIRTISDIVTSATTDLRAENERLREALDVMLRVFKPHPREDTEGWREEHDACSAGYAALSAQPDDQEQQP